MSMECGQTMSWARYIVNDAVAHPGQDTAYGLLVMQTSDAHLSRFADAILVASVQAQAASLALQREVEGLAR